MLRRQRRQQLDRRSNYLPGLLIVLLVLLQSFELHMCRQLMGVSGQRRGQDMDTETVEQPLDGDAEKRTVSQPEEIFSAPSDAADMSYDEYPMVVPKRAALLLDRLMVALHHALENEREGHRIGDFYANKNLMQLRPAVDYKNGLLSATDEGVNPAGNSQSFHMYSDDDPGVLLDYDFKDLNQINRATGETLMAKSFQRRAGLGGGSGTTAGISDATASAAAGPGAGPGPGSGLGSGPGHRRIHHAANGGGRMYWRCYFNAVSCF